MATVNSALPCPALSPRFEVTRRLFPPIPGIRDKVSDDVRVNPEVKSHKRSWWGWGARLVPCNPRRDL